MSLKIHIDDERAVPLEGPKSAIPTVVATYQIISADVQNAIDKRDVNLEEGANPEHRGFEPVMLERTITQQSVTGYSASSPTRGVHADAFWNRIKAVFQGPKRKPEATIIHEEANTDDHYIPIQKLFSNLGTDPVSETPMWVILLLEIFSGFGALLWVAAILCFLAWRPFGDPADITNLVLGIILIFVAIFQGGFTFFKEREASSLMAGFSSMTADKCNVIRSGTKAVIPSSELVMGDIITLSSGDKIPADIRIISHKMARVEKSSLTGESEPLPCSDEPTDRNFLESSNIGFLGSSVVEGEITAVVIRIGNNTALGKIASLALTSKAAPSTLQKEINYFISLIAIMALFTSVLTYLLWWFLVRQYHENFLTVSAMISNCVGIIVAFIPDGLPIALTATLTLTAEKMKEFKLLVKNIPTVQTLGSVTVIASDKTGTLTKNKMTASYMWFESIGAKPLDNAQVVGDHALMNGYAVGILCNKSSEMLGGNPTEMAIINACRKLLDIEGIRAAFPIVGEIPFNSRKKYHVTVHKITESSPYTPFELYKHVSIEGEAQQVCIVKGAPEIITAVCNQIYNGHAIEPINGKLDDIAKGNEELANMGQRVIAVAFKVLNKAQSIKDAKAFTDPAVEGELLKGFCLVALIAINDPPREGVANAIKSCHKSGIKVMMVTGDHPSTAVAIAREIGIFSPNSKIKTIKDKPMDFVSSINPAVQTSTFNFWKFKPKKHGRVRIPDAIVVTGPEIPRLEDLDWEFVLSHGEVVFARTTPQHKLLIVRQLQRINEVVVVTGDGVNDAPALKKADVGIAMGINGTSVSKEAANMVLLDDDFSSVIKGIAVGRLLFDNLKKVVAYLLPAGSFSEILPVLANVFLGIPLPLSPFLMICICVFSDVIGSLAFVNESAEKYLMDTPPRDPTRDRLVNMKLISYSYLQIGLQESIIAFYMFFYTMNEQNIPPEKLLFAFEKWDEGHIPGMNLKQMNEALYLGQCAFFCALVMTQIWNLLASRNRSQSTFPHRVRWELVSYQLYETLVVLLVCYLPVFQENLDTRPLSWYHFVYPLLLGSLIFLLDELRRLWNRHFPKSFMARIAW